MTDREQHYRLAVDLAERPCFCCGCWCLGFEDARRMRRVLRLTRAVIRAWRREEERGAEAPSQQGGA